MQVLRLNEVLTRVVAWHNRHPLAQRIQAGQVHSIGEVLLPFASAVAGPDSAAPAPLPSVDVLPDAALVQSTTSLDAIDAARPHGIAEPADATPDLALDLALDLDMAPEEPEVANMPTDRDPAAPVEAEAVMAQTLQDPFALAEADMAAADLVADRSAERPPPDPVVPADMDQQHADLSLPMAAPARAASEPPAARSASLPAPTTAPSAPPPPGRLRQLLTRLTGHPAGLASLPRLQAAFSRNFIWPLSPARVARWTRKHGQTTPVAPPDWPRRQVEPDALLLAAARRRGLQHGLHLHLLTAAIGVGDRRIRVLIGAHGAILGPRAYSRPRVAAATSLLTLALLGTGWGVLRPGPGVQDNGLAAVAVAGAVNAASAPAALAAAPLPAQPPDARASDIDNAPAEASLPAPSAEPRGDEAPPPALAAAAASASAPMGRIKPLLSEEDRQAARQQAAVLRGTPINEAPPAAAAPRPAHTANMADAAPVYAVVTRARRQHQSAAQDLALLRSVAKRLSGPLPVHGELMQNQGEWRAAWWPFANLADAERARVLLAGRGLKAEVVAF